MKKLLSLCITLIFVLQLFTLPVHADPVLTIEVTMFDSLEQILEVKGQITNDPVNENRLVTIVATPKDVEVNETNISSFKSFILAEADSDGKYVAKIGFSQPEGEYDFHAIYGDGEVKKTFNLISHASFANYIRQIKNGTILKENLYSSALNYQNAIDLNLADFATDKEKAIFNYRFDVSRALLAGITDAEIIEDFNDVLTFADGECDFIEGLEAITYSGSYYQYLLDNQSFTNINFTAYNALNSTQKDAVTSAFINRKFANADEVKTFWDSQVANPPVQPGYTPPVIIPGVGTTGGGGTGLNDRYINGEATPEIQGQNIRFNDIYSVSWAAEAITRLAEAGIIDGVAEGKFDPDGMVTREQFAKLLAVTLGIYNETAVTDFSDAKNGWYTPYIASVKNAGLINGVGDGQFGVGRNITRQDMAVMIYNALKFKGVTLAQEKTDFTDFESIEDYAKDSVKFLAGAGIINGMDDGSYAPVNNATRAQAAVLIYALKGRIE